MLGMLAKARKDHSSPLHLRGTVKAFHKGAVRVELWVRQCSGQHLGDARTVWNSVSWIMVEEVSRPQS